MHSGSRRRRLDVKHKESPHRVRRVGYNISIRSSGGTNPDTESSTINSSADSQVEAKANLPVRRGRGKIVQQRDQSRRVKASAQRKDNSQLPANSTQRRRPARHPEHWKTLSSAGAAAGLTLVLSGVGTGLDRDFIRAVARSEGTSPQLDTAADAVKYSALMLLSYGIWFLVFFGLFYLFMRTITSYRDRQQRRGKEN